MSTQLLWNQLTPNSVMLRRKTVAVSFLKYKRNIDLKVTRNVLLSVKRKSDEIVQPEIFVIL